MLPKVESALRRVFLLFENAAFTTSKNKSSSISSIPLSSLTSSFITAESTPGSGINAPFGAFATISVSQ